MKLARHPHRTGSAVARVDGQRTAYPTRGAEVQDGPVLDEALGRVRAVTTTKDA